MDESNTGDAAPLETALDGELPEEHFKPTGTLFVLVLFVATIVLLWASVYVILLSRGVTL
ncbi:MAG: cytochrome c oxidase subunit 2A [Ilumatobacter sp.]|uniref:cytochrome c oxidase subunit 2A n=1 Tax=Ilumatobacter sp. TaxID=1967498 RepID=UPI0026329D74|nr:cytochrome c oxidase subunit 2A [Ilumatobacter sp.]MDJ0767569.1 cytochrome c oxidase subunit 2A [Ilumatobacter sp.]